MQILLTFEELEKWLPAEKLEALSREAVRRGVSLELLVKEGMMAKADSIVGTKPKTRQRAKQRRDHAAVA